MASPYTVVSWLWLNRWRVLLWGLLLYLACGIGTVALLAALNLDTLGQSGATLQSLATLVLIWPLPLGLLLQFVFGGSVGG